MDLGAIDHLLDVENATCRVVIETPKGSRCKYTYDRATEAFEMSSLLPTGMSFPLDFGLVPRTLADDGDALDILVIGDEPAAVGCLARVRLLGVIKAMQTERDGRTHRNDRLVGRLALSVSYAHARNIEDLGGSFVEHLGRWFTNFNALKGKGFDVIGVGGADETSALILEAGRRFDAAPHTGSPRG
jgi:inorganic pyrophosphatase